MLLIEFLPLNLVPANFIAIENCSELTFRYSLTSVRLLYSSTYVLYNIIDNQITCYDNSGGKWKDSKVTVDNEMRITLELNDPFLSGRGRINCTAKNNSEWLWFGYQFTVE